MALMRAIGLVVVAGAVAAGTWLGRPAPREIPRAGEYFVLSGDFHVHAAVGDGGVPPWMLAREARRRGLDVIAVTNHNQTLAARIARLNAGRSGGALVLIGQEVTTPRFHIVAAGIRAPIDWRLPARDAIRAIHAQGGVAIAAHPSLRSWRAGDPDALALLDGTEAAHPSALVWPDEGEQFLEFHRTAAALNPSLAPIGSSDFHFGGTLGQSRTYVFAREPSEQGVLDAIRAGRTVADDGSGQLTGDRDRVNVVKGLIASDPPPITTDRASRIAALLALLGTLVLVLFK